MIADYFAFYGGPFFHLEQTNEGIFRPTTLVTIYNENPIAHLDYATQQGWIFRPTHGLGDILCKKLVIVWAIVHSLALIPTASAALDRNEPVSYAGHGVLYDYYGEAVVPTQEFVTTAQQYYLQKLKSIATPAQQQELNAKQESLAGLALSDKELLYANYRLLEWYIGVVNPDDASRYRSRNKLLRQKILSSNEVIESNFQTIGMAQFEPTVGLRSSISAAGLPESIMLFSTSLGGDDYKIECEANSVPSPPGWGDSDWDDVGILGADEDFIGRTTEGLVHTYKSTAPEGLCIALPRKSGSTIGLLGVICMSKVTGKTCFWDNQVGGVTQSLTVGEPQPIPGPKFSGGIDLTSLDAGECTSCHAGENPFNMHPNTNLGSPTIPSADLFPDVWYKPIVNPDWAQNAGPGSLISGNNCTTCHTDGGQGGRFPEISTKIRGYCNDVLRKAVGNCGAGACVDGVNPTSPTMPPSSPGSSANAAHVLALIGACDTEPRPIMRISETTLDYGEVEIGFSFSKGLVIHNDGNDTLEVSVTEGSNPGDFDDEPQWTEVNLQTTTMDIDAGDPPVILRQTYTPTDFNNHSIYMTVTSNDSSNPSERITLTGTGVEPTPIDSVLVLDRSGSMDESAGDRRKIEAMRDATSLYADLLRPNAAMGGTVDKLGFVKYNDGNSEYMPFESIDAAKRNEIDTKLSDTALTQASNLKPQGGTGIGGAMQTAASILLPSPESRRQVMVVLTDGHETETPYINSVIDPIQTDNPDLMMFSIGLGDDIEPDKLQNISNIGDGYHQVAGSLSNENLFDLETFYFKIFAEAADMDLVVDPTHAETIISPNPIIVDTAGIISSDRSATFLVLDDPVLRQFYDLDFLTPTSDVIVPGVTVGGIGIQQSSRHNYKLFRIIFPSVEQAATYVGDWSLRLTPNGRWDPKVVRKLLKESEINYSGWLNPFQGTVPIGFAAAVTSDYRLNVTVNASSFVPGADVKLTANLTDRLWPAPNGSVTVKVTDPNDVTYSVALYDDGSHGDAVATDATWTNTFSQTSASGSYKFLFRSAGHNERGELGAREASRYLTLEHPDVTPGGDPTERCIPCLLLRWLLALALILLFWIWYCTCWRNRLG